MATDYYKMGMGLGGAYFDGKEDGRLRQRQMDEDARKKVIQGREDETYARAQTQIRDEDTAVQQYGLLNTQGKRNQPNIQANDADFDMAVEATGRGLPMPAAQPQMPEYTPATDLDRNQGMQGIMRARRDWNGVASLQKEEKAINLDTGRKAEYARLGKMKPEELAGVLGDEFSRDGSGVDAMLTFDPKSNKYLFASKVPGFPSQTLSRTELLNQAMGIWEAGNGDMRAGLSIVMDTLKTKRQLDDSNFNRSAKLAEGDAGLHYKGREADAREAKNKSDAAYQQGMLGVSRDRANAAKKEGPDPKLVAQYNDLMIQSEEATDPRKRAELDQQMRRVAAQISTGMGKPMQVRSEGRAMAPMSKIEEAGTGFRDNATGGIKYADGRGGYVAEGGVMPQDRAGVLKKANVPDNLIGQLPWNADGTSVGFAGQAYNVNDPEDMRALAKDYARLSGNAIAVDEAQKMDNHYMNNPPKTHGRAASIYDTPEQRAAHTRAYDARNQ